MKQVERYFYPAVFSYAPDQEIAVTFPDLDVATSGTDDTDALLSARELLGCVLCGLEEDGEDVGAGPPRGGGKQEGGEGGGGEEYGEDIPAPTPLADAKLEDGERAVLVDVYMPSVRLARVNRSVNRTVTLPAWLNAAALERNVNFSQVLQDALRTQLHLG